LLLVVEFLQIISTTATNIWHQLDWQSMTGKVDVGFDFEFQFSAWLSLNVPCI